MEIVILLVPLAFLFLAGAIAAFVWALRRGQFDDMDSPSWRIIFDDRESREKDDSGNADTDGDKHNHDPR